MRKSLRLAALSFAALCAASGALAKVSPQEAEKLGKELTCMGAEKAGNADGSIPAWSGKWAGTPPGVDYKGPGNIYPDPYANEKPLFVITAKNMDQYAARLTEGQKALFKRYPETFRMPVYPSHRDFRYADWVCDAIKKNAVSAELNAENTNVKAYRAAPPFPIPKSAMELLWNHLLPRTAWQERAIYDQFVLYQNGSVAKGRVDYFILAPAMEPNPKADQHYGKLQSYFKQVTLAPERSKGEVVTGYTGVEKTSTAQVAYQYNPGTRRVRQMPEYGFDVPIGAGGFRTVDDDRLFNGSHERYDLKMLGKREVYLPYHTYRADDKDIKYTDLLKPGHANPDYMRYELHRVWVLEFTLKPNYRHLYAKRVLYIDEDTWLGLMSDNYDARGQLWRVAMQNTVYAYDAQLFLARGAFYHDLVSGAYMADRLMNEQPEHVRLEDAGGMKPADFTPEAAARSGR